MQVNAAEAAEKLAPYLAAKASDGTGYDIAMLKCPECGSAAMFIEVGATPGSEAARKRSIADKKTLVREALAAHLLAHQT